MRVLFTCVVGHGHFHPLVPLARAFEVAGHEVAFATDPWFCPFVRDVGFTAFPAGLDHKVAKSRFIAETPDWDELDPVDQWVRMYAGMFGRVRVPPMLVDLRRVFSEWRPDVVIHDTAEMAGAIAAEAAGLPHAEHSFGILRPAHLLAAANEALRPISAGLGIGDPGVSGTRGELYLDVCPPGIQQPGIAQIPNVQALRPIGFDAAPDTGLPAWFGALPPRPTVYVTMGTVFNQAAPIFRAILDGLAGSALNVVVTVGSDGDPGVLGPQPGNVHVERYIPQSELLPRCDLVISHGGSGTLLGALSAGVPIVAVPQGADQFLNAEAIQRTGIGLRILPEALSAETVRDRVGRVLGETSFALAARAISAEIARMPSPARVVPRLEAMVAARPAAAPTGA
jgi:UDP:flavonoid glycosyltransferase YjiC (YdhE family)